MYLLDLDIYGHSFRFSFKEKSEFNKAMSRLRYFHVEGAKPLHKASYDEIITINRGCSRFMVSHNIICYISSALREEFLLLHGSCISADGKNSLAFIGSSGSGKTTAALIAYSKGFEILSDDVVMIRKHDMALLPFPKPMSITPLNWRLVEECDMKGALVTNEGRLFIACTGASFSLGRLYCLYTKSSCNPASLCNFLLQNTFMFGESDAAFHLPAIMRILSTTPVEKLRNLKPNDPFFEVIPGNYERLGGFKKRICSILEGSIAQRRIAS